MLFRENGKVKSNQEERLRNEKGKQFDDSSFELVYLIAFLKYCCAIASAGKNVNFYCVFYCMHEQLCEDDVIAASSLNNLLKHFNFWID